MELKLSRRQRLILVGIGLVFAALACNAPVGGGEEDIALTLTQVAQQLTTTPPADSRTLTPVLTPTETVEGEATTTLPADVTPSATECSYGATFVKDVTIPDGTEILAGEEFTKTWQMMNTGCLDWPSGTQLVFLEGDQMDGPATVSVNPTSTNGTRDISVVLKAPATPGEYTGYWKLKAPDGLIFGQRIFVKIKSVQPEDTPTATTESVTNKPDLVISKVKIEPDPPLVEKNVTITVTVRNDGDATSAPSVLKAKFEGKDAETEDVPSLAPNATHKATFTVVYNSAGKYTLTFTADADGDNAEHGEDNNEVEVKETFYRPKTYFTGSLTVPGSFNFDLDAGHLGSDGNEDLWWHTISATERYLEPKNGALIGIAGTTSVGYSGCSALSLSANPINGSPGGSNQIPEGTYVCVLTSDGRYSQFRINTYGQDLTIGITTWELSDTD